MSVCTALSIAGSDPSGGAGIQADLKAFSARGVYGMAALTALTAQNTTGVTGVHTVPPAFVADQIQSIFDDVRVDAIKIGMIAGAETAQAVGEVLAGFDGPIVLDPVMVAKGGHPLLPPGAVEALRRHLLPKASLITPNLPEAAALIGASPAGSRAEMEAHAHALVALGCGSVLLKGGHLETDESPDVLATAQGVSWLDSPRIETANTHGTGCSLSSAIAAELAKGQPVSQAVVAAKSWLTGAIGAADTLGVGHGHGPVHHFHALWPQGADD